MNIEKNICIIKKKKIPKSTSNIY